MSTEYEIFFDDEGDPDNPGWVCRATKAEDDGRGIVKGHEDIPLDASDEDSPEAARHEAAKHFGIDPTIIRVIPYWGE